MLKPPLQTALHLAALVLLLGFAAPAQARQILYVDADATGTGDGSSWTDAFPFLQDALAKAQAGDEIWVAAGRYTPDLGLGLTQGDRNVSFSLKAGVSLIGGFSGTETSAEQRDLTQHETVLSGDLLGNDVLPFDPLAETRTDNSVIIVLADYGVASPPAVLDGFTIEGGQSNFDIGGGGGSGISIREGTYIVLRHLRVQHNFGSHCGGGIHSLAGSFLLSDSEVIDNQVDLTQSRCGPGNGGGLYHLVERNNPLDLPVARVERVLFRDNRAGKFGGGGAMSIKGAIHVIESVFANNEAGTGGAIAHESYGGDDTSHGIIANSIFTGNVATEHGGGAFLFSFSHTQIINSIFNGNALAEEAFFSHGGALALDTGSHVLVANSIITNNRAAFSSVAFVGESSLDIYNSIVWDNPSTEEEPFYVFEPEPSSIRYSIIDCNDCIPAEGFETEALLLDDPSFVDPTGPDGIPGTLDDDLRLSEGSIAIDAGSNALLPADAFDLDQDGNRTEPLPVDLLLHTRTFGAAVDMGAYEADAPPVNLARERVWLDAGAEVVIYPNPAQDRFWVVTQDRSHRRISLYDILGRKVGEAACPAGSPACPVDVGRFGLGSGVYWIRVTGRGWSGTQKVILLN